MIFQHLLAVIISPNVFSLEPHPTDDAGDDYTGRSDRVYALLRLTDEHLSASRFLSECGLHAGLWFLTEGICYEFLRVATHPRVFPVPLTAREAMRFLDVLLNSERFDVLAAGRAHWACLRSLLAHTPQPSGNIFFDLRTVALMTEHAVRRIYTADTDFFQFKEIEVVNPLN